ncbi:MAG: hypothetical protein CMH41_04810 [Micrococcales bacterium]|nr:hypothetical protein [Micrococcales bacterium]
MPKKFTLVWTIAISLALAAPAAAEVGSTDSDKQKASALVAVADTESVSRDRPRPERQRKVKRIRWKDCTAKDLVGYDCARLKVPRNWSQPNGPQFDLKMFRLKSTAKRSQVKGSLFTNPGGPGFSGRGIIPIIAESKKLRKNFDLVAWDPRGVPDSQPILKNCPSVVGGTNSFPNTGPFTWRQLVATQNSFSSPAAAYCNNNSQEWVEYIGTNNVVADLDAMRAAVGDKKLTYFGYSYGTTIGKVYAQRYPDNIRALGLDAVTQPNLRVEDYAPDNSEGARKGFRYLESILPETIVTGYLSLNEYLANQTIPSPDGSEVTRVDLWALVLGAIRNPAGIDPLVAGVCSLVAELGLPGCEDRVTQMSQGDLAAAIEEAKRSGPSNDILTRLINCVDLRGRPSVAKIATELGENKTTSPAGQIGGFNGTQFGSMCRGLPRPVDPLPTFEEKVTTSTPLLLVSGKYDLATPFTGAKQTNGWFRGSRLISVNTSFHGLYPSGISCIDKPINKYLLKRKLPRKNLTCDYSLSE